LDLSSEDFLVFLPVSAAGGAELRAPSVSDSKFFLRRLDGALSASAMASSNLLTGLRER